MRIIRNKEYKNTSWTGGTTTEIYLYPEDGNYMRKQFDYRISTATIEIEESLFTELPGIERVIVPLEKRMVLLHGEEKVLLSPYEPYRFSGGKRTISRGVNRDFNLMMNHGKRGDIEILMIYPETSIMEEGKNTLYFYEKGVEAIKVGEEMLFPGDSILVMDQECIEWINHSSFNVTLIKVVMPGLKD
ncbi:MAG: HutD family protein [Clostridiaceae bacterium]